MHVIKSLLYAISAAAQLAFILLFLLHNQPGLSYINLIVVVALLYGCVFVIAAGRGIKNQRAFTWLPTITAQVIVGLMAITLLVYVSLDNLVFDYFQAVTTSDPVIYAWLISWTALLILLLITLLNNKNNNALQHAINFSVIALLGVAVMGLVAIITTPMPHSKLSLHSDIFVGGVDGYKVYRIPALLVLPTGAQLSNGERLKTDRIIAMAEARRDAALDTGVIDLVQKTSDDGGLSWSKQKIICQYKTQQMQGKCGNATPVFDAQTGVVFLAYNLSGIPTNAPEGSRPHKSYIKTSNDGGLSWNEGKQLNLPNSVFGPGHGIQKQFSPFKDRLVIPFNTSVGGQGSSSALVSDDHGKTWQPGQPLGRGNENELAELANGDIMMATRHIAPVGSPPTPNGRLFSVSQDGGNSWAEPSLNTQLITPICQASLLSMNDRQGLLFLNPANVQARVQLTLRHSSDNGQSWDRQLLIYPGPAGYSQLGMLSDDSIIAIYEGGNLSYSEKISFAKLPKTALLN